jgi:hypothetical protein
LAFWIENLRIPFSSFLVSFPLAESSKRKSTLLLLFLIPVPVFWLHPEEMQHLRMQYQSQKGVRATRTRQEDFNVASDAIDVSLTLNPESH